MREDEKRFSPPAQHRIWTVPNLISFLRILTIPLIAWLIISSQPGHASRLIWALILLSVSAASDGVDGYIARKLNQVSVLGQILDPVADRLLIISSALALCIAEVVPWWIVILLASRDLFLLCVIVVLAQYGYGPLPVHFVGKTGTFLVMAAIPVLIVSHFTGSVTSYAFYIIRCLGLACVWWGIGLYWLSGIIYTIQAVKVIRHDRQMSQKLETKSAQ